MIGRPQQGAVWSPGLLELIAKLEKISRESAVYRCTFTLLSNRACIDQVCCLFVQIEGVMHIFCP